jgi:3-hydroxybutyryl-CoA dehydrogenase
MENTLDTMPRKISDIKEILILGAGTLGLRIGLQAAISGFTVVIYDLSEEVFAKAKATQSGILKGLAKRDKLDAKDIDAIQSRITWTSDLALACKNPDLVSESVPENLEIKKKVWSQVGQLCPEKTLFTTNTSYMLSSWMAEETGRPDLFCAFHFHDVFFANVVDIMPHANTAAWFPKLLEELGKVLNQTPVHIEKESPGYIFNAMLLALLGTAGHLVTSGVCSPEDVDKSWIGNFKMEMGPFGIMDNIGLDTVWHVTKDRKDEKSKRFAEYIKNFVDAGKLGVKTGEGFYTYPHPAYKEMLKE